MLPVRLGRSGLLVSPLSLGTMTFGVETPEPEARAILDLALERGVFTIDTADMYGAGASEEILGRALAGRRAQVVLASKGFAAMGPGPNDRGLSSRHLLRACEASLRRLQTDWLDLYYLHVPDPAVPTDESLRAMEDLVRSGKVRYVGCSNYRAWETVDLLATARQHGWQPLTAVQPVYNLANRDIEVELLPMAHHHGLGVFTYSPLARGILTGKYRWESPPPPDSRLARNNPRFLRAEWRQESVELAERLAALAAERGTEPGPLALRWAMANRRVHSVVFGARTAAQASQALSAAELPWDAGLEAACDALVPPGSHTGRGWQDDQYQPVLGRVTG